tara:strand:+ start:94 stop:297 length:204 start_codon:yes stop_codon:yes gene_type:complete
MVNTAKYEEMLEALTKQETEVKATFTKIQGAKEVVQALLDEAKKEETKEEGMKVSKIEEEKPKNKGK